MFGDAGAWPYVVLRWKCDKEVLHVHMPLLRYRPFRGSSVECIFEGLAVRPIMCSTTHSYTRNASAVHMRF